MFFEEIMDTFNVMNIGFKTFHFVQNFSGRTAKRFNNIKLKLVGES